MVTEGPGLLAVYIDGETKTGKGAASRAVADALQAAGYAVYYDVAGNFYRRFVALVRRELNLDEAAALPEGDALEHVAERLYSSGIIFEIHDDLGDLQRPAISNSVSILGTLPLAQRAGQEWFGRAAQQALSTGADVLVLDGRNPRDRIRQAEVPVRTVLDLYMRCEPEEAARRALRTQAIEDPSSDQLEHERLNVIERREQDRNRPNTPFIVPSVYVMFAPHDMTALQAINQSWQRHGNNELPLTITLDNTHLTKPDMLAIVSDLAVTALQAKQATA
jgi:cytidylate kinase